MNLPQVFPQFFLLLSSPIDKWSAVKLWKKKKKSWNLHLCSFALKCLEQLFSLQDRGDSYLFSRCIYPASQGERLKINCLKVESAVGRLPPPRFPFPLSFLVEVRVISGRGCFTCKPGKAKAIPGTCVKQAAHRRENRGEGEEEQHEPRSSRLK